MSLILKGIDMPKKGETTKIEIDYGGTVWESKREWVEHENCAIQIPKGHGRLIDESFVSPIYAEEDNLTGAGMDDDEMEAFNDGIEQALNSMRFAPTILEAEEE